MPSANVGGVYAGTVVFKAWDIRNGADSGGTRPVFHFGFRNAASSSNSLVADVQFTATSTGVAVAVRDSVSTFPIATLPSVLPATLSATLTIDRSATVKTYTLAYAFNMQGGEKFSQTGNFADHAIHRPHLGRANARRDARARRNRHAAGGPFLARLD